MWETTIHQLYTIGLPVSPCSIAHTRSLIPSSWETSLSLACVRWSFGSASLLLNNSNGGAGCGGKQVLIVTRPFIAINTENIFSTHPISYPFVVFVCLRNAFDTVLGKYKQPHRHHRRLWLSNFYVLSPPLHLYCSGLPRCYCCCAAGQSVFPFGHQQSHWNWNTHSTFSARKGILFTMPVIQNRCRPQKVFSFTTSSTNNTVWRGATAALWLDTICVTVQKCLNRKYQISRNDDKSKFSLSFFSILSPLKLKQINCIRWYSSSSYCTKIYFKIINTHALRRASLSAVSVCGLLAVFDIAPLYAM